MSGLSDVSDGRRTVAYLRGLLAVIAAIAVAALAAARVREWI